MWSMGSIFFQISSILYILLIGAVYFSKKRLDTIENRIFIGLIVVNFLNLITDILSVSLAVAYPDSLVATILAKTYLVNIVAWMLLYTYYVIIITTKRNKGYMNMQANDLDYLKKIFTRILIIFCFVGILIYAIPLNIFAENGIMYTYGPGALASYTITGLCLLFWFIYISINHNNITYKKYIPILAFVLVGGIAIAIQVTHPEFLLVTSVATFVTILTFFTIENPDLKMIEELNQARLQADRANMAKTDFLSSMSHEIRTPLNAIVGFSHYIEESKDLEEAKENARDIVSASETLLEIVNGVLDISKIEAGKLELTDSVYDAKELFESSAKLVKSRVEEKGLDFQINIASDIPRKLYGDYTNFKKVLVNLLSNAAKYTSSGHVKYTVNCITHEGVCRLVISVEDSGRGIKSEDVNKLFTKFQRFDEDRNTTIEGTGLGLAITKHIIEMMSGEIVVQSTFGSGSKFTVTLNQRIHQTNSTQFEDTAELRRVEDINIVGKKILIVDDNKLNLKVASKVLQAYDPVVEVVDSGFECIEKLQAGEIYDLILMDDMMPRMTGVETFHKIKEEIPGFDTPVVALTANAIAGMREKYLADGFDEYLAKPINKVELEDVLRKMLNNKETKVKVETTDINRESSVIINPAFEEARRQLLNKTKDEIEVL